MVGNMPTGGSADLKNLASGIQLASQLRAEIISISLGALFDNDGLIKTAVHEALNAGAIIVAAAGQTFPVNMIPLPARLSGVIAVTASAKDKKPWRDAFVGRHIAWSAPGAGICHIKANPLNNSADPTSLGNPIVALTGRRGENLRFSESLVSSSGTSYSTAYTAAAAALWLQFHSSSKLRNLYGARNISALFAAVAKRHAMERPADWQSEKHGQGILNIRKLIEAPLPCNDDDSRETCDVKLRPFLSFTP
jgi:subtilisin family serine protease